MKTFYSISFNKTTLTYKTFIHLDFRFYQKKCTL